MKLALSNGYCCGRCTCKNVDRDICHPMPKENEDFVECDYYEGSMKNDNN
jgi:hypothetical protein